MCEVSYSSWANLKLRTKQRKLRINLIVGKIKINLKSNVNCNVYTIVMINLDFNKALCFCCSLLFGNMYVYFQFKGEETAISK